MSGFQRGTAACPECGARAGVMVTDGHFKLVCDTCGLEVWGETVGPDDAPAQLIPHRLER